MKRILTTFSLSVLSVVALAQSKPNLFDFTQTTGVPVFHGNDSLADAWAGGLNYVMANTIDLNLDNVDDLVLYDRNTKQVTPYINTGTAYDYAPEYRSVFPQANSWMKMRDFNCDGKNDIFFNEGSYIRVWENTSSGGELSFAPATNGNLETLYGSSSSKSWLFVSSIDVPGIADIDNDGDIDIVTYENAGIIMEYHENKANCGLDFELEERCWGHFTESGIYRELALSSCTPFKKKTLHSGSSTLVLDLNGDGVQDILTGNISYPEMIAAFNGGTQDSAHFTSQDTLFPSYDTSINTYIFPMASYADVDTDGKPDLIASPADQSEGSADNHSVLYYKNTGTAANPQFQFQRDDFAQNKMIDLGKGATPRLVDLDGDSLMDLVVANTRYFLSPQNFKHFYYYYQNTGTSNEPEFTLTDTNLANISSYPGLEVATVPCFGDLDDDGDNDMIVGDPDGQLFYFANGSSTGPSFTFQNVLQNIDVGNNAAPYLFDVDKDDDLDLFVGNDQGKIYFYRNSSKTTPNFTLVTSSFGGVDVKQGSGLGNSMPCLFENNGVVNLFVGSEYNNVVQYDSIGSVAAQPAQFQATTGSGTLTPGGADLTPFGFQYRAGRNQFLIRASELKAAGLKYGFIQSLGFDIVTSNVPQTYPKLSLKLKMSGDSVLTGFETGLTEVYSGQVFPLGPASGWSFFQLTNPFLWDGESNLVVEFCYQGAASVASNVPLNMTDVGYNCNAYGSYVDRTTGCSQTLNAIDTKRPNMRFEQVPTTRETSRYGQGQRTAPAISDLNNDGYPDMILGSQGGGLYYYEGKEYTVSLPESPLLEKSSLNVYPNPGTGVFTILIENESASQLSVFDLSGRLILKKEITSKETQVNLENQSRGIYIFVLQTSNGVRTQKVIRE